jgi:hypothetical protein
MEATIRELDDTIRTIWGAVVAGPQRAQTNGSGRKNQSDHYRSKTEHGQDV